MDIVTVKNLRDGGWLVNGTLSVPNDDANRDCQRVRAWLAAGNAPAPADPAPVPPTNQELADALAFHDATFKGFALVVLDEINLLRAQAGLPARTVQQLKNAVAGKMHGLA